MLKNNQPYTDYYLVTYQAEEGNQIINAHSFIAREELEAEEDINLGERALEWLKAYYDVVNETAKGYDIKINIPEQEVKVYEIKEVTNG